MINTDWADEVAGQDTSARRDSPEYTKASKALADARAACFNHPDRPVLGMSHGPFSGVNVALGIIATLEDDLRAARAALRKARADGLREAADICDRKYRELGWEWSKAEIESAIRARADMIEKGE